MSPRLRGARNAVVRLESVRYRLASGTECKRPRLALRWRGPNDAAACRHRISLGVDDTRQNRRAWEVKLRQMEREIIAESFDPAKWFGARFQRASDHIDPVRFGEFANLRARELLGSGNTDRTMLKREQDLRKHFFTDPIADITLAHLHSGHLEEFRGRLMRKSGRIGRLRISTVNKICGQVKSMAQQAYERGLVPSRISPAVKFKHLRNKDRRKADPFTPDELLRIFAAATDPRRKLYYMQQALTGLRPSEGLGLFWDCVNLEKAELFVRRQTLEKGEVTHVLKTPTSERAVQIFEPLLAAYRLFKGSIVTRLGQGTGPVFVGRVIRGQARPMFERTEGDDPWRRTLARAEVPYRTLENLRHSYTTLMLSAGKNVQWIADQLGHTTVRKIQDTYGTWVHTPTSERLEIDEFFARFDPILRDFAASLAQIWPKQEAKMSQVPDFAR